MANRKVPASRYGQAEVPAPVSRTTRTPLAEARIKRLNGPLVDAGPHIYNPSCGRRELVPSANYRLFERAMRERKPVLCVYDGYPRELCPIILGHSQQQEKALTYQFGGQSKSGLPPTGEWRCLWLAKVSSPRLRDGPWRTGSSHTQPQGCVEIIDLDVNPHSPYRPKRAVS